MKNEAIRIDRALRQPAFPLALAGVALGLFSWPMVRTPPPAATFAYPFLFVAWALVILALFLISRSEVRTHPGEPGERGSPSDA